MTTHELNADIEALEERMAITERLLTQALRAIERLEIMVPRGLDNPKQG